MMAAQGCTGLMVVLEDVGDIQPLRRQLEAMWRLSEFRQPLESIGFAHRIFYICVIHLKHIIRHY